MRGRGSIARGLLLAVVSLTQVAVAAQAPPPAASVEQQPAKPRPPDAVVTASVAPMEAALKARIARDPHALAAYEELHRLYRDLRRYDDSERTLLRALDVKPGAAQIYEALVSLYRNTRQPEKALRAAEDWTKADPSNADPEAVRAMVNLELGSKAMADRSRALEFAERSRDAADRALARRMDHVMALAIKAESLLLKVRLIDDPTQQDPLRLEANLLKQRVSEIYQSFGSAPGPRSPSSSEVAGGGTVRPTDRGDVVRVGGSIRVPAKTKHVDAEYPEQAVQARIQGTVILEIVVGEDGAVSHALVLRSLPLLDEAALAAVRQWQYEPTIVDGLARPVSMIVSVEFGLSSKPR